jgi:uridine phosphorylase|tara:strand:+ start:2248 stop:2445 length:198 start_codon:yes stop_codon:yes gene_type:complete
MRLKTKRFKTKTKPTRVCTVTGIVTSEDNFYSKQTHVKAVDNIRRNTGATKQQLIHMFKQINSYK